jgi:dTDP-4-amino-4,6-dideoxygalactose transaminase
MINVTRTFFPPLEEYVEYLKGIWERKHLTNHGPLVLQLEEKLKGHLECPHLFFLNNGTIALQIAIKALGLKGKVITTPFSYVATTSSIVWENCEPVFVDIDPHTLCIDPLEIEKAITPDTTGILATHVYGHPCDVEAIGRIAEKNNLKVIYDGAHAFGVRYKGESLMNFGDVTTLSFHATKIFHTGEGGAVMTRDAGTAHRLSYMRNFGHNGQEAFWGLGVNGKSSELHAAMGLSVLPYIDTIINSRRDVCEAYDELLKDSSLKRPGHDRDASYNYAYYPVIFPSEEALLAVREALNREEIFPRRYFYPSLAELGYVKHYEVPVARDISRRIACLPLYHDIEMQEVRHIASLILQNL